MVLSRPTSCGGFPDQREEASRVGHRLEPTRAMNGMGGANPPRVPERHAIAAGSVRGTPESCESLPPSLTRLGFLIRDTEPRERYG